jgi:SAM-dependent methyltransferase
VHDDGDVSDRVASGYDTLAERGDDLPPAESPWGDSAFQRYHAWPETRSKLPSLDGRRVLLAGCGRGDHVADVLDAGATVVGVDASRAAIERARARFADAPGAVLRRADLTDGLPFDDDRFDLAVSHLVASHLRDWRGAFGAVRRVLVPDGRLVVTTIHPSYLREAAGDAVDGSHDVVRFDNEWPGASIPTYYRPPGEALSAVADAGFRLDAVDEPRPSAAYREHAPERARRARERPELLVLDLVADARAR